jgi:octaprenyl-diphosphate synthase
MASLIHDDILDGAPTRRSQPALHARWGTHRAVLMGDWLFATSVRGLAERFPLPVTRSLLWASSELCDGELEETDAAWRTDVSEERYLRIIAKKTAALMAAAAETGAMLGGAPAEVRAGLKRYGWAFGMAFQLIDDALDFSGDAREVGKPVGSDLIEGKFTMPVLSLRPVLSPAERVRLDRLLTPPCLSNGGAQEVVAMVKDRGGVRRTLDRAEGYLREALEALAPVPAAARAPLAALAGYALGRRK